MLKTLIQIILNLYIKSFVDNSVEFKMYLNEEIKRLKEEVRKAKASNLISADTDMLQKTEKIIEKLDSFKNTQIHPPSESSNTKAEPEL